MALVRFLSVLVLVLALLWGAPVRAQAVTTALGPQSTERIEAELVPMGQWAVPGSTAIIAIRQKIQPGWHTYWRNPGDSGGPTEAQWVLPQGFVAGDIVWPLPERQRLQTLMNYGYSDVVYLPVPVEVPATAKAGQTVRIAASVLFMVCSDEMCVPDELELAVDLPVGEGAPPLNKDHGAAIQRVLENAPRPADITAHASLKDGVLTLGATGGPLAGTQPKWAYFFPFEGGMIDHAALQQAQRGEAGLSLTMVAGRGLKAKGLDQGIEGVLATDLGAWEVRASEGAIPAGTSGQAVLGTGEGAKTTGGSTSTGFLKAVLFALVGGLILNLMPCVFPVLAMKAAALGRAAHDPREARKDGLGFLAGVLVTFVALAGLLLALRAGGQAIGWGFQLQSPAVTAALALLMLAVGLNMSGLFHIGGRLQGIGSGLAQGKSGVVGAFFTGVLAVVVAAPCTAPFMALALGAALVMPWPMALAVFVMLGLGLALPYVLVSFSPRILSRLPRPGAWMETFRNLLAFPMYGAALWLAWVFARQTGDALGLLFVAGLLLAFTLWLCGRYQSGGRRLILAVAIVAAVVTGPAIVFAMKAPPVLTAMANTDGKSLASQPWSGEAVETALAQGRPVLVNFTADWCVTCKINERAALASSGTAKALVDTNAVYMVGDWTNRDDAIARELERHGRSGVPLYLLYTPGKAEPRILPQLLTEGLVVKALSETTKQD
ncbi:protein-disulfide reductase DsbD family protein [Brevundimonas sp.]|uniref:protein-disulfide reductase DsbD family protein n=1 Tax=Brevundimonas sp. TaxID=1871086 RepID=UPI002FC97094